MEIGRSLGMTIHRLNRLNFETTSKALERLSSGLRVNRASDDAAGLSISESFRSQVRGTHQAVRNAQDGINLLRTAEGAFSTIQDVLQRMRELAVQGGNGTLDATARGAIQAELEQLKRQIDQTAYFTTFNGIKLLVAQDKTYRATDLPYTYSLTAAPGPWSDATAAETLLGGPGGSVSGVTWDEFQSVKNALPGLMEGALRKAEGMLLNSGIDHAAIAAPLNVHFVIDPTNPSSTNLSNGNVVVINLYSFFGAGVPPTTPRITLEQAFAQAFGAVLMQREDAQSTGVFGDFNAWIAASGSYDALAQFTHMGAGESYLGYGKPASFSFDAVGTDGGRSQAAWFYRYMLENHGQAATDQISHLIIQNDTGNKASIVASVESYLLGLTGEADKASLQAAVNTWIAAQPAPAPFNNNALANTGSASAQPLDQPLTLQVGANFGDVLDVTLLAGALGNLDFTAMVNVMDQNSAARSLTTLDRAIAQVSNARGQLGAAENRLEYTINRLSSQELNMAAADSRVRDADVASEMQNLTRGQIMAQASLSSLVLFHQLQQERTGALLNGL